MCVPHRADTRSIFICSQNPNINSYVYLYPEPTQPHDEYPPHIGYTVIYVASLHTCIHFFPETINPGYRKRAMLKGIFSHINGFKYYANSKKFSI